MTKGKRVGSETDVYHVVVVGIGHQVIFEDDGDRCNFYSLIERVGDEECVEFYAWCFMGNHVHMVVRSKLENLSRFILRVETMYVRSYNDKHLRTGPLFQRPFWSEPILTEERLLVTVRYVHQNPLKPKLARTCAGYEWSSYRQYMGTSRRSLVNTGPLLLSFDGAEAFSRFHETTDDPKQFIDVDNVRKRRTNEESLAYAHKLLGVESVSNIALLSKPERDERLRLLKSHGLTQSSIAWMTGLGRSVISRA